MEYNYTREFKQPIKMFLIPGTKTPIPLVKNGLNLEHIIVGALITGVFILIGIVAFVKKISFIQNLISTSWLLILIVIGVIVWTLFSLKWDNKNFFKYIIDRFVFKKRSKLQFEHGHTIPNRNVQIVYSSVKWRDKQ